MLPIVALCCAALVGTETQRSPSVSAAVPSAALGAVVRREQGRTSMEAEQDQAEPPPPAEQAAEQNQSSEANTSKPPPAGESAAEVPPIYVDPIARIYGIPVTGYCLSTQLYGAMIGQTVAHFKTPEGEATVLIALCAILLAISFALLFLGSACEAISLLLAFGVIVLVGTFVLGAPVIFSTSDTEEACLTPIYIALIASLASMIMLACILAVCKLLGPLIFFLQGFIIGLLGFVVVVILIGQNLGYDQVEHVTNKTETILLLIIGYVAAAARARAPLCREAAASSHSCAIRCRNDHRVRGFSPVLPPSFCTLALVCALVRPRSRLTAAGRVT